MYGIPNMKLDKGVIDRRIALMRESGIKFVTCAHVGKKKELEAGHMTQIMEENGSEIQYIDPSDLLKENDALLIATGATKPFDPTARNPGRDLKGIQFAMDFLTRNTKSLLDSELQNGCYTSATDKHVIVIGGGDTGADCIGTSLRHGCKDVVNFELLDKPPVERAANNPWPQWPRIYRLDYSHAENKAKNGEDPRAYHILAKEFVNDGNGQIKGVKTVEVDWSTPTEGGAPFSELEGTEKEWPADLVLLATGFVGPELELGDMLGVETQNPRGNWQTFIGEHGEFTTNVEGIFTAGDCRRGQSLVVWAINEGRGAARAIDIYLMGNSLLPAPGITQGGIAAAK